MKGLKDSEPKGGRRQWGRGERKGKVEIRKEFCQTPKLVHSKNVKGLPEPK